MNDGIKITIEEWAGDNNIELSGEQVEELADAIDITYNMMVPCGYGVDQMESKEKGEIKQLKAQIDLLERYIKSKGYNIILHDDRITRNYMRSNWDRSIMEHETFK
nr:MAG TPA: hypothetical protein [Caudoviricetes sp.]